MTTMDATTLAKKMLEWQELISAANKLEKEIAETVLVLGKTQTVGNVKAAYSNGRRTFDYETPAKTYASSDFIKAHTKVETIETTDWKTICSELKIEPIVASQSAPSVSVKLVG